MLKGSVEYAPSTFEERGAAVAFTTPLLSQTRVRRGERSRLEVLIPSLSEGLGIYVVAWKAVPEMVGMTMHDRYLHELIVKQEECSPQEIRSATLRAARRGLAGPEAVKAARQALEEEEEQRTLTNYLLLMSVLKAVGLESADVLKAGLDTDEGQRLTRQLMARAAAALRMEPNLLYARLAQIADTVAPVGLAQSPKPGRLLRGLMELKGFKSSIEDWSNEAMSEAAPVAAFCAEVAQHTVAIGDAVLGNLHRRVAAIGQILRDWDAEMAEIRRLAARIAWLLDGWDHIAKAWEMAMERDDRHAQSMVVNELFRIIPLVPRLESDRDLSGEAERVAAVHRRSVRAFEDWRTGRMDVDAIRRIEMLKAKAA
ncbi:hypothetical protein [Azospirillum sp. SYSU D00513]|uniref:hypothetical protein n=1 Tax=Azospirillum sp. SYSU D00513 TaxID=2812561 RepID=UPI001A95C461|nr:hypothetical protein [Azospirillum sp. SYSU D00513]